MENGYYGLRIAGVNYESMVDGEGCRMAIFFSGCPHYCEGCHNPETHDPEYGTLVTDELIDELVEEYLKRPYLNGITLSGGEPLMNIKGLNAFLAYFDDRHWEETGHKNLPSIWLYTGFTWEYIISKVDAYSVDERFDWSCVLHSIEVVVDGKFEQDKADKTLKFRGSSNQRIILCEPSLSQTMMDSGKNPVLKELSE